jgi:peptidoglycan/xylan/chitin deacetylase (PgdA/CDA1 family)
MNRMALFAARVTASALSPAGSKGRLWIMLFHRVRPEPDPMAPDEMTAQRFADHLASVASVFNIIPLPDAVKALREERLPARAACITFDDGYRDNVEVALPILQRLGLHTTFFIASGYLDGGRMWNDTLIEAVRRARVSVLDLSGVGLGQFRLTDMTARRKVAEELVRKCKYLSPAERERTVNAVASACEADLPGDLMMRSEHVAVLVRSGMEIGAHTATHPILERISLGEAEAEIVAGRDRLQALTGGAVRLFAYPNGRPNRDYSESHARLVCRLGFEAAFSTASGVATGGSDMFQLPRFTPWDSGHLKFVARALANLTRPKSEVASAASRGSIPGETAGSRIG